MSHLKHLKNTDGLKINWYTVIDVCNMSDKTYKSFNHRIHKRSQLTPSQKFLIAKAPKPSLVRVNLSYTVYNTKLMFLSA